MACCSMIKCRGLLLNHTRLLLVNQTERIVFTKNSHRTISTTFDKLNQRHQPPVVCASQRIWGVSNIRNQIDKILQNSRIVRCYSDSKRQVEVSFEELRALTSSGDIKLIDVREPDELEEYGRIPGAVNIPLSMLKGAFLLTDEAFQEHYKCEKPQKYDTNIVFHGLGPIKSTAALELAFKIGYKKARHYKGGWEEYSQRTGQPLKKSASN